MDTLNKLKAFKFPEKSLLLSPAPYHILSYGALFGTQFFHTFVNSVTSFKVLERQQFGVLQRAVFPAYFGIQTAVPIVLALTYPGRVIGRAVLPRGIYGVLHPSNRWGVLVPLTAAFVTGLTNLLYFLPETNKVTALRRQSETKESSKRSSNKDKASKSKEAKEAKEAKEVKDMKALNQRFGRLHGYSSLFNMVTIVATVVYGVHLSARIA